MAVLNRRDLVRSRGLGDVYKRQVRNLGHTYSKFIAGLNNKGIELDRKMLSELAIQDKAAFEKVVKTAID